MLSRSVALAPEQIDTDIATIADDGLQHDPARKAVLGLTFACVLVPPRFEVAAVRDEQRSGQPGPYGDGPAAAPRGGVVAQDVDGDRQGVAHVAAELVRDERRACPGKLVARAAGLGITGRLAAQAEAEQLAL